MWQWNVIIYFHCLERSKTFFRSCSNGEICWLTTSVGPLTPVTFGHADHNIFANYTDPLSMLATMTYTPSEHAIHPQPLTSGPCWHLPLLAMMAPSFDDHDDPYLWWPRWETTSTGNEETLLPLAMLRPYFYWPCWHLPILAMMTLTFARHAETLFLLTMMAFTFADFYLWCTLKSLINWQYWSSALVKLYNKYSQFF